MILSVGGSVLIIQNPFPPRLLTDFRASMCQTIDVLVLKECFEIIELCVLLLATEF